MPEPYEYRILQSLQTALEGISAANGFWFDVDQIAVKLDADAGLEALLAPDGPQPRIILEPFPEVREYLKASRVALTWPIDIHWAMQVAQRDDETLLQTFFRGSADVERAIAKDISRGGLADDTLILNRTNFTRGARVWSTTRVQIRSKRLYGLP